MRYGKLYFVIGLFSFIGFFGSSFFGAGAVFTVIILAIIATASVVFYGRRRSSFLSTNQHCLGCKKSMDYRPDGFVRFRIMYIRGSTDYISGAGQVVREKEMEIVLHYECLKEYIWKVTKHIASSAGFADVEVETSTKNGKATLHVGINNAGEWDFKTAIEGGRLESYRGYNHAEDMDNTMIRMIENRDTCLLQYRREDEHSIPLVVENDNPLVSAITSTKEFKDSLDTAYKEFLDDTQEAADLSKKNLPTKYLIGRCQYALKTKVLLDGEPEFASSTSAPV